MKLTRRPPSTAAKVASVALPLLLLGQGGAPRESGYGDVAFGPEIMEFRMGIALQKAPALAGYPISMRYSFENTRQPPGEPQPGRPTPPPGQGSVFLSEREPGRGIEISLVDARGEEVPRTLRALDTTRRTKPPTSGHMSGVGPGQTRSVGWLWLQNHYDLSMPGRYRLRVTRFRFTRRDEGGADLTSGEIVFDVLEPPPESR